MSKVARGKQFEKQIKEGFSKLGQCSIDRIPDQVSGYSGSANICDFIIYKHPTILYLECKSCYGNTLNFSNISKNQLMGLTRKSNIAGVMAGVVIWFIDHDKTVFIPIQIINRMITNGYKSINILKYNPNKYVELEGRKRKILYDYNLENFFKEVYELNIQGDVYE